MSQLGFPDRVRIVEVGPRDGLQNEAVLLPTRDKVRLLHALARAGLKEIEITSFTHPKWIPSLADAEEVALASADLPIRAFALVPNRRGLDRAINAKMTAVTLVMSASEGHNRANLNRGRDESLRELVDILQDVRDTGISARVSLSVVFGCPFDGDIPLGNVVSIVEPLVAAGTHRIGLCDTIGIANPRQVHGVVVNLKTRFPEVEFELHLHDTYGRALANTLAGLQAGIASFDTSIGGLGGCPYAPGATGNVATETTASMLHRMGIDTGIDLRMLVAARAALSGQLGKLLNAPFDDT